MGRTFKIRPKPDQESVWDYPRPPRLEQVSSRIHVVFGGITIADSLKAKRVLETSHPPVYYIPVYDIKMEYLKPGSGKSVCEWKGKADYYIIQVAGQIAEDAAWTYRNPKPGFMAIKDHVAFYASKMEACCVDNEVVIPQPGGFYGGWITSNIVGPFKGEPGTMGW